MFHETIWRPFMHPSSAVPKPTRVPSPPVQGPRWTRPVIALGCTLLMSLARVSQPLADDGLPVYLQDRGEGLQTSLFGSYVKRGELLVYTFYEYTHNSDHEYKPSELGYVGDTDFRGELTEHDALIFLSYGLSDRRMAA